MGTKIKFLKENIFHILLADDDDDDIQIFQEALNLINIKHKLTAVKDGEEAFSFIKDHLNFVDFIFLDINMPKLNGSECLNSIKHFHPSNDLKIIMLSTAINDQMVNLSYRYGADMYIQKPTNFADLVKYISYCLDNLKQLTIQKGFVLNQAFINS